jgi:membrane protein DedA with SNARE-associated domain
MESFLVHAGYGALILFAFLEGCCVPIPSEITFGFGGVLAYQGHLNLALVIILGTLAELAGSFVSYGVGRVAERPVIERFGRYLLITKSDLDRTERFLTHGGWWVVPVGRILPLIRSFTSLVAGFAGMSVVRFGLLSLLGTLIYGSVVASIGYGVGSAWNRVVHDFSVAGYVIAAVVVAAIVVFVVHRLRTVRREAEFERETGADYPPDDRAPDDRAPRAPGHRAPRA